MSAADDHLRGLATGELERLEAVLRRFEDAWQRGERPELSTYLPAAGPDRHALLRELAHIDLEYRLKAGEAARVEDYLSRFPELSANRAAVLALIRAEYERRRARER